MLYALESRLAAPTAAVGQVDANRWAGIVYYSYSGIVILFLLVAAAAVGVFLLLGLLKLWTKGAARRYVGRRALRAKFGPDGAPYPPAGRGMCDSCSRPFDTVYHLPEGRRLCPRCYRHYRAGWARPGETA